MRAVAQRKRRLSMARQRWLARYPVVLVLASGRGERFRASGGTAHKLDALLAGEPVLTHTLRAVRASGLPWHLERANHTGMGDCMAAAVAQTRHAPGWLILPGDLPLVQPTTLRLLADELRNGAASIVQPLVVMPGDAQPLPGHPVAFAQDCLHDLLRLSGDEGARLVLKKRVVRRLQLSDVGCVTDVDTVDLLQKAELIFYNRRGY